MFGTAQVWKKFETGLILLWFLLPVFYLFNTYSPMCSFKFFCLSCELPHLPEMFIVGYNLFEEFVE
jgi:hypothetical protein